MKIAIPQNSIYNSILKNVDEVCKSNNIGLMKVTPERAGDLFRKRLVDVALLSPLDYFRGVGKGDYRIIPGPCLAVKGYSGLLSLNFRPNLRTITNSSVDFDNEYLLSITRILLAERYDMAIEFVKDNADLDSALQKYDASLLLNHPSIGSIDITEDWFLSYDIPLPLAYWVGINEEFDSEVINLIKLFADTENENQALQIINSDTDDERIGKYLFQWNDTHKEALERTADLFYYHTLVSEIADINVAEV
jgi:hypothetical protein